MQQSCLITDSSKIFPNFLFELSSPVFLESADYLGNKEKYVGRYSAVTPPSI